MSLTNPQFKAIMKAYDYRRTANAALLRERREKVYAQIPQLLAIENEIAQAGLAASKTVFTLQSEHAKALSDLKDRFSLLKTRKLDLLEENGYPRDYLDPIYDCPHCQDTGYVGNEKCSCLKQAVIDASYELSNIKEILMEENFDTFRFDLYSDAVNPKLGSISSRDNMRLVHKRCQIFVNDFETTFSNLILYGQAGLGKTFLCNCIAKEILDQAHTVIYLSAFQLFKLFETYRFNNEENTVSYEDIDGLYTCDLLIIDDLGSELINSFTSAELFNCLNTRILKKRSTVISTNLEPSEWSKYYSNRIVSRIFGHYYTLKLFGDDIRVHGH